MPAFPVEAKAVTAATTTRPTPTAGGIQANTTSPAVATGVRSSRSAPGGITATSTLTPAV